MTEPVQLLKHALQQKTEHTVSTGTPATVQTIPIKSAKYLTGNESLSSGITYNISGAEPLRIINHGNGLLTFIWEGIPLPTSIQTVSRVMFEIDTSILSLDYAFFAFANAIVGGVGFQPLSIILFSNTILITFMNSIQTPSEKKITVVATGIDLHSLGLENLYVSEGL